MRFTRQVWNDAGLLREYIGHEYRSYFTYRISGERFARMVRLVKRLASLAGRTVDEVLADLAADAEGMQADEAA